MALFKRGNVWWMDLYCGANRRRIRKTTGTKDKTQARMIEQAAIAVNRGISTRQRAMAIIDAVLPIDDQALKIDDARDYYAQCMADEGIRLGSTTREHRLNVIGIFAEWAKANTRCETVEQVDSHIVFSFAQMLNTRKFNKGGKPKVISVNTKNSYIGDLITVWKMFVKRSKAANNPWTVARFQRKREEEKHGRAFTQEEIERLLSVARQVGFCWEEMITIGMYTGLRQSDCANLKWSEIDFDNRVITLVPHKTAKHGTKVIVPIHKKLLEMLIKIRERKIKGSFVLPDRCGSLTNRKYPDGDCPFNTIIEKAGVSSGEHDKLSFHCLRHTFVSRLAEAGTSEEVRMRLAGHTSSVTHQVYTHDDVSARKAIDLLK